MQNSMKGASSRNVVNFGSSKAVSNHSTHFLSNNKQSNTVGSNYKGQQANNQGSNVQSNSSGSQASITNSNIKRLSAAELKTRREKGLCYYCDEKYRPSHWCKISCFLLVGQDEMEELLNGEDRQEHIAQEEEESQIQILEVTPNISINALAGHFHPSTLRVLGHYRKKQVKILIDNGSNNNFIKPEVADKLSLKRTPITEFKVWTGSGTCMICNSKCEGVALHIQGYKFVVDLFVLEIRGSEVVLGVQWLIQLGTIKTNYQDLSMEFSWEGEDVMLKGDNIFGRDTL